MFLLAVFPKIGTQLESSLIGTDKRLLLFTGISRSYGGRRIICVSAKNTVSVSSTHELDVVGVILYSIKLSRIAIVLDA